MPLPKGCLCLRCERIRPVKQYKDNDQFAATSLLGSCSIGAWLGASSGPVLVAGNIVDHPKAVAGQ